MDAGETDSQIIEGAAFFAPLRFKPTRYEPEPEPVAASSFGDRLSHFELLVNMKHTHRCYAKKMDVPSLSSSHWTFRSI